MKLTLHKLKESFIVTSDEAIEDICFVYHLSRCQLFKIHHFSESNGSKSFIPSDKFGLSEDKELLVVDCLKVIAQQDQIDFSALTKEEQKKIGWFDGTYILKQQSWDTYDKLPFNQGFLNGFQKAQELLSDRMFTIEDIKNAFLAGVHKETDRKLHGINTTIHKYLEEINASKSWEIEIEMGYPKNCCITKEGKNSMNNGCMERNHCEQVKFTNDKIKITKIL